MASTDSAMHSCAQERAKEAGEVINKEEIPFEGTYECRVIEVSCYLPSAQVRSPFCVVKLLVQGVVSLPTPVTAGLEALRGGTARALRHVD